MVDAFRKGQILVLVTLVLAGCDSFDFGRVTGHVNAPPSAAPDPSAAPSAEPNTVGGRAAPSARDLVLVLGGDIALGGNVKAWLSADKKYQPLAGLRPILEGTDLTIATLVSPLTAEPTGAAPGATPVGPPSGAEALARAGIRLMDVGSERLWSSGKRPFTDTLANLSRAGILAAGGGADAAPTQKLAQLAVRGTSIAVVALSDASLLPASVRSAKKENAVVIVTHGGSAEYAESPTPDQIALARSVIEAGADFVVLHGAHVPLGVGWIAGHPVFYGLGNLVADGDPKNPWTGRGFVAKIAMGKQGVGPVDLCPFLIANGEPKLLSGASRATEEGIFKRAIERLSEPLGGVSVGDPDLHSCLRVTPRVPPP